MPLYRTVILDCDSTLSDIEGIDELAVSCRAEVQQLTDAAMRGLIPLEQVYERRLHLVRPTRAAVESLARQYVDRLVPDARETIAVMRSADVDVRIISGGLRPAVVAVAAAVGVDPGHVAAVDVYFNPDGSYAGFDTDSPLAASGGKRVAIERWNVARPVMMVGDGTTDLETRPVVDRFVAFAGIVERATVVREADAVIRARSLAPLLPLVVDVGELARPSHRALFERGAAMAAAFATPLSSTHLHDRDSLSL